MSEQLWIKKVRESLKKDYTVNLSGENITDISYFPASNRLKILNLSFVQIKNLIGMKKQKNLNSLIANNTQLESFAGFDAFPNLHSISIQQTPVFSDPNAVLSLLLICPKLVKCNGKIISKTIRDRAKKYPNPELAAKLISKGFIATYPITEEELEENANYFGIELDKNEEESYDEDIPFDDFDISIQEIEEAHERMIRNQKMEFNFNSSPTETTELTSVETSFSQDTSPLATKIASLLLEEGFQLDHRNIEGSVIDILEKLCEVYESGSNSSYF